MFPLNYSIEIGKFKVLPPDCGQFMSWYMEVSGRCCDYSSYSDLFIGYGMASTLQFF